MNPHGSLSARVARRLASHAFTAKFGLELSLLGAAAEGRRERWVSRCWPLHVDLAREILADILPDVLAVTYRDHPAASRALDAAEAAHETISASLDLAIASEASRLSDSLTALFEGPLLSAVPAALPSPSPVEVASCSRS